MTVKELIEQTGWQCMTKEADTSREVNGVYCSDLLSWVMGKGQPDQAWITVQSHINVIAVAVLREFSCVILAEGAHFPEEVIARAEQEDLVLLESEAPVYETAKKLMELGI
ncbi:MAG: hypothetical protein IJ130_11035 [Solobacterium sp.]|nr:AraC family transcriptional regulator [Erysipelotrichaceae bacterium]MBQ9154335.1 hypothetical protein [Solobacterium sp.]